MLGNSGCIVNQSDILNHFFFQKKKKCQTEKITQFEFLPNGKQPRDSTGMSDFYEMEVSTLG